MRDTCKCDRCGAIIYLADDHVVSIRDGKLISSGPIRCWDLCEKCTAQVMDIITHPNYEAIEIIDPFDSRKGQ